MKKNEPYKQFSKDCPIHFSRIILIEMDFSILDEFQSSKKKKSTRNAKFRDRFWNSFSSYMHLRKEIKNSGIKFRKFNFLLTCLYYI